MPRPGRLDSRYLVTILTSQYTFIAASDPGRSRKNGHARAVSARGRRLMAHPKISVAVSEGTVAAEKYWTELANGRLSFQRCAECGLAVFPSRVLCPRCLSDRLDWRTSGGSGTVYCCTFADGDRGAMAPFAMVVTDEGFVVPTRIVGEGCESASIGSRVRLAIEKIGDRVQPTFQVVPGP